LILVDVCWYVLVQDLGCLLKWSQLQAKGELGGVVERRGGEEERRKGDGRAFIYRGKGGEGLGLGPVPRTPVG